MHLNEWKDISSFFFSCSSWTCLYVVSITSSGSSQQLGVRDRNHLASTGPAEAPHWWLPDAALLVDQEHSPAEGFIFFITRESCWVLECEYPVTEWDLDFTSQLCVINILQSETAVQTFIKLLGFSPPYLVFMTLGLLGLDRLKYYLFLWHPWYISRMLALSQSLPDQTSWSNCCSEPTTTNPAHQVTLIFSSFLLGPWLLKQNDL